MLTVTDYVNANFCLKQYNMNESKSENKKSNANAVLFMAVTMQQEIKKIFETDINRLMIDELKARKKRLKELIKIYSASDMCVSLEKTLDETEALIFEHRATFGN
jgi:hypothetical protein